VREVLREAERQGIDTRVLAEGEDAGTVARQVAESGAETLGMAGGDGSLAPVAAVALERDLPFVCIPSGTRNHFARDLGLDDHPLRALGAFQGPERRVDVGAVHRRIFLNNVSLGLYASLVHDHERETGNRVVAFARMVPAALGGSRRPLDVSFEVDGRREHHPALVVLVANNDYKLQNLADLGERARLDEGRLHAYVIEAVSRRTVLALLLKASTGNVEEAEGLVEWAAPRLRVDLPGHRIHAALDGEAAVLEAPLEFEIKRQALRVLLPPPAA
jgi:diacylglycerol kinase family enzyme